MFSDWEFTISINMNSDEPRYTPMGRCPDGSSDTDNCTFVQLFNRRVSKGKWSALYKCTICGRYASSEVTPTGGGYRYDLRVGEIEAPHLDYRDIPQSYEHIKRRHQT